MRRSFNLILWCGVLCLCATARAQGPVAVVEALEATLVRVKETVAPAVVSISAVGGGRLASGNIYEDPFDIYKRRFFGEGGGPSQRRNVGSGVVIDSDGYVLTNHHVIAGTEQIFVTLSDGKTLKGALLGSDSQLDLAVIKVELDRKLRAPEWVPGDQVRPGQFAIAFGNPWGLARDPQPTVTLGIVSAVNRSISIGEEGRQFTGLIQTDAAINPGNSGGPLVDIHGRLLGINTAIFSTTGGYQGIGFAVPFSERVVRIVEQLKQGRPTAHPWLGLTLSGLDAERARLLGFRGHGGLLVDSVDADGPAARCGILAGDIIVTVNGEAVEDPGQIRVLLERVEVGDELLVQIVRKGQSFRKSLTVAERRGGMLSAPSPRFWRGLSVRPLPPGRDKGVLVDEVAPASPAWDGGIRPGDVITKVNDTAVTSPAEFRDAIEGAENQDVLVETLRGLSVVKRERAAEPDADRPR